jgi:hypothetical protein
MGSAESALGRGGASLLSLNTVSRMANTETVTIAIAAQKMAAIRLTL